MIVSCNQSTKQQESTANSAEVAAEANEGKTEETNTSAHFNMEDITFSTADIGDFPFINLPKGLKSMNKPFERKFDVCFFPINGIMTPFEGRLYKINVTNERVKNIQDVTLRKVRKIICFQSERLKFLMAKSPTKNTHVITNKTQIKVMMVI